MQLQCKSNNIGIRNRLTIMFEFTSPAGVLPSYDMETMVVGSGLGVDQGYVSMET